MNAFDKYVNNYDMNIPEISYKYYHSYRVMDNMVVLAKNMNFSYEDINLAKCIGLLHDIGRFEQFAKQQNFDDNLFDHGDYGAKIIEETNILSAFNIKETDYKVVYQAIKNHNKYEIDNSLNKRERLFSKMIRDADKLDILYALNNSEIKSVIFEDDSVIRDKVKEAFFKNKAIKTDEYFTTNENIVTIFAFAYDINFNLSLDIIKHKNYYQRIYERLKDKKKFKIYIDYINKYISERTE